jgi:hypothetical protein
MELYPQINTRSQMCSSYNLKKEDVKLLATRWIGKKSIQDPDRELTGEYLTTLDVYDTETLTSTKSRSR